MKFYHYSYGIQVPITSCINYKPIDHHLHTRILGSTDGLAPTNIPSTRYQKVESWPCCQRLYDTQNLVTLAHLVRNFTNYSLHVEHIWFIEKLSWLTFSPETMQILAFCKLNILNQPVRIFTKYSWHVEHDWFTSCFRNQHSCWYSKIIIIHWSFIELLKVSFFFPKRLSSRCKWKVTAHSS